MIGSIDDISGKQVSHSTVNDIEVGDIEAETKEDKQVLLKVPELEDSGEIDEHIGSGHGSGAGVVDPVHVGRTNGDVSDPVEDRAKEVPAAQASTRHRR